MAIAILGVLVGLLLTAVQAAREAGRRSQCANNLKQIALAALLFEEAQGRFPAGARSHYTKTYSVSWWVDILPFLEAAPVHDQLDKTSPFHGSLLMNSHNAKLLDGYVIGSLICPSSPLPRFHRVAGAEAMMPSYVGVSGAANGPGFSESRVTPCCLAKVNGEISGGGLLVPNRPVKRSEAEDGLSRTMLAGETSTYGVDKNGVQRRIDGGFNQGWQIGTRGTGTPPHYGGSPAPAAYNIATIRHPLNTFDFDLPGIDDSHGANNPLVSAHPNGVHVVLADGSVHFLLDTTDIVTLKRLATRDDGEVIEGF